MTRKTNESGRLVRLFTKESQTYTAKREGKQARPQSGHPNKMGHLGWSPMCSLQHLNTGWPECQDTAQRIGPALGQQRGQSWQVCQETLGSPEGAPTAASFNLFLHLAWVILFVSPCSRISCSSLPKIAPKPHGWLFLCTRLGEKCS